MQTDAIDQHILQLLRQDGRMSNTKLAETVGLSPSACLRRLRLLEDSGIIRGYTAIIEEPEPGDGRVVIIQITLERQSDEYMRKFETAVRKYAEVRECYLMTGMTDYFLRVEARSLADYERIHTDVLSRLPGVSRIQSSFTIRNIITQPRFPR
jgi:DNA-binding Lrp family transcriptional regulator